MSESHEAKSTREIVQDNLKKIARRKPPKNNKKNESNAQDSTRRRLRSGHFTLDELPRYEFGFIPRSSPEPEDPELMYAVCDNMRSTLQPTINSLKMITDDGKRSHLKYYEHPLTCLAIGGFADTKYASTKMTADDLIKKFAVIPSVMYDLADAAEIAWYQVKSTDRLLNLEEFSGIEIPAATIPIVRCLGAVLYEDYLHQLSEFLFTTATRLRQSHLAYLETHRLKLGKPGLCDILKTTPSDSAIPSRFVEPLDTLDTDARTALLETELDRVKLSCQQIEGMRYKHLSVIEALDKTVTPRRSELTILIAQTRLWISRHMKQS